MWNFTLWVFSKMLVRGEVWKRSVEIFEGTAPQAHANDPVVTTLGCPSDRAASSGRPLAQLSACSRIQAQCSTWPRHSLLEGAPSPALRACCGA
jgi:hypothetical protein